MVRALQETHSRVHDEATEVLDGQLDGKDKSDPNDCSNTKGPQGKRHRSVIEFDSWFSDDEFVNRIKRAKRRRMEIVSDSEKNACSSIC